MPNSHPVEVRLCHQLIIQSITFHFSHVAHPHVQHYQQHQPYFNNSISIPIVVSDDVVSGTKRDGWMSPVRRFFILLVTFDALFTALLWVITVIVTGRDVFKAMRQQVLEYTIHDSMFDVVVFAAARFLVSLLFYAALDVGHWLPVAFTTGSTSVFTVAKVFEYQWTRFGSLTFDVMLVLSSFVIAWGELWHLDFRVLPLEHKAKELQQQQQGDERTPLLGPRSGSHMLHRYVVESHQQNAAGSVWEGSVANFYSPLESPEDSGDEIEPETLVAVPRKFRRKTPLSLKVSFNLKVAYRVFHCP